MAVVLALTKGRSSSSVLLSICRQWCAYTLAADIYPHVRWVPSQRHAADDSSRNRSRHLVDSDVAETQIALWAGRQERKLAASDKSNIKSKPKPEAKVINANEDEVSEANTSRPRCAPVAVKSERVKAIQRRLDEAAENVAKSYLFAKEEIRLKGSKREDEVEEGALKQNQDHPSPATARGSPTPSIMVPQFSHVGAPKRYTSGHDPRGSAQRSARPGLPDTSAARAHG